MVAWRALAAARVDAGRGPTAPLDPTEPSACALDNLLRRLADIGGRAGDVVARKGRTMKAWPFEEITPERWAALTERQKGIVEATAQREIEALEARGNPAARTSPPSPLPAGRARPKLRLVQVRPDGHAR